MSTFPTCTRLVSRPLGTRWLFASSQRAFSSTPIYSLADTTLPATTSTPFPTQTHTPSAFAARFQAAKYERSPVTPFSNPETLTSTPLPSGTQLPATADPLLDFTAALLQKHGERTKSARTVARILSHIHLITGGAPALPIFREAVRLVSPSVKVVTQKRRAKNLPTPRPLTERARTRSGILAILKASDKRGERKVWERVGRECVNVLRGESDALKKLEEVHRFAVANR